MFKTYPTNPPAVEGARRGLTTSSSTTVAAIYFLRDPPYIVPSLRLSRLSRRVTRRDADSPIVKSFDFESSKLSEKYLKFCKRIKLDKSFTDFDLDFDHLCSKGATTAPSKIFGETQKTEHHLSGFKSVLKTAGLDVY